MFVGRYDCPHGGETYDYLNIRLHFYCDPIKSIVRWRNVESVYFATNGEDIGWVDYKKLYLIRAANMKKANADKVSRKKRGNSNAARGREALKKKREGIQNF